MNREIKFRVYGSEYMSNPFTLFDLQERKIEFATSSAIMQFTGLLDKNGKEIYEGDVVECGYGKGSVIHNTGCFMVQWIDDKEAYMEFVFSRKGMYSRKDDEQFEIIGNIYEQPELTTDNGWQA